MTTEPAAATSASHALARWPAARALAALALLVVLMFGDVLASSGAQVLGAPSTDMALQFVSWREFGFGQLRHGNLALWNPHIYGGAPYFGGAQAALLYPPNWVLLFLPTVRGINLSIAINVWLLGAFTYAWAGYRGLAPLASLVAAALLMLCGPHFMHVYAGHPVHMASMAWAPLLLLAVDGVRAQLPHGPAAKVWGFCLLGAVAEAMQLLAGHPQYAFYSAIAAALYLAAYVDRRAIVRTVLQPAGALAVILIFGAALASLQLLVSIEATSETVRSVRLPFEFASMFGFPPENLATLLSPYVFGDMSTVPYWGRCYLWEMSLYFGVAALALATYAVAYGRGASLGGRRDTSRLLLVALVTFVIALGVHTPLFRGLYTWAPGFDKFRSISKFTFQSSLFLVMLAATGLDAVIRKREIPRRFVLGTAGASAAVLALCVALRLRSISGWGEWFRAIAHTGESYLPTAAASDPAFAQAARSHAASSLLLPAFMLALTAAALHFSARWRHATTALALVAVAETYGVAMHARATFDAATIAAPEVTEFLRAHPGDARVLNVLQPNSGLSTGASDLWGFDPGVVRRYAEFITWTQGASPDKATQYVTFRSLDPLYAMLRLRYAMLPDARGVKVVEAALPPMKHVQLIATVQVAAGRDAVFSALRAPGFDPRTTVVLESAPSVAPDSSATPGSARVIASSTDWLEIEADAPAACVLLITDTFTPSWRAIAQSDSAQQRYEIMPANYILRGIPLSAGHHHLRVEYAPRSFRAGLWTSAAAWLLLVASSVVVAARLRRREGRDVRS